MARYRVVLSVLLRSAGVDSSVVALVSIEGLESVVELYCIVELESLVELYSIVQLESIVELYSIVYSLN